MKQWYEELFQDFADNYDRESFTSGTLGEVDFIEREISYNKKGRILDIGCGTGRHSLELARRGYSVTGIDLSPDMIGKAKALAQKDFSDRAWDCFNFEFIGYTNVTFTGYTNAGFG